jgi:hypothetical protein
MISPATQSPAATLMQSVTMIDFPSELVQYILSFAQPRDVATFSRTCRWARDLVYSTDQYLWRELFLNMFDDPKHTLLPPSGSKDWQRELQMRVRAFLVAKSEPCSIVVGFDSPEYLRDTVDAVISVAQEALPVDKRADPAPSYNTMWIKQIRDSFIFRLKGADLHWSQKMARLRTLLPLTPHFRTNHMMLMQRRNVCRCYIYDLRNYGHNTYWGPFFEDGSINWAHVDYLTTVVLTNLLETSDFPSSIRPPLKPYDCRPFSAPGNKPGDWAKVEGPSPSFLL